MIFAGDLMMDRGVGQVIQRKGPDYLFTDVKPLFSSQDFVVVNFESAACDSQLPRVQDKKFTFRANPEWLPSLRRNGITHAVLANNHSGDFGARGLVQTDSVLMMSGLKSLGYNPAAGTCCEPALLIRNEDTIAVFSSVMLNHIEQNSICHENCSGLADRIRHHRSKHADRPIVVILHWGIEMTDVPTEQQVRDAHALVDAGADLIVGHHPHVVQSVESYQGRIIFYSLGNFIFDNPDVRTSKGILASITVSKHHVSSVKIIPYNIAACRPAPMGPAEALQFMDEVRRVSPSVKITADGSEWIVNP